MINWIKKIFGKSNLEKEVETLKQSLEECSNKLLEKQEHINTTNAYWKKKMREAKTATPSKKKKDL